MNPFIIEQKRIELSKALPSCFGRCRLWLLADFYKLLLESRDQVIIKAYADEFLDDFISGVLNFNALYTPVSKTEELIKYLDRLSNLSFSVGRIQLIKDAILKTKNNLDKLKQTLNGISNSFIYSLSFPLLYKDKQPCHRSFGIIESLKIKISKTKNADSFIIVPSPQKLEEQFEKQIKICFNYATGYVSRYSKKVNAFHEVIIYFENRSAFYEGNSFGIAMTIGFIEELTKLYNLPYLFSINEKVTSTGGINETGKALSVSGNNIKSKVEIVFYSPIEYFIIPKADEKEAEEKLQELKEKYSRRKLNLVSIDNINELIDRRSLIQIRKQPIALRIAKEIKENWIASLLLSLIMLILVFVFINNYDSNPSFSDIQGNELLIKNKSGKLLWKKTLNANEKNLYREEKEQLVKITDIDNDGSNEVLICCELAEIGKISDQGRISCYDSNGNTRWIYSCKDSVETRVEKFKFNFISKIIGVVEENHRRILYLFANHERMYPSVIYKLDLITGERLKGELWNPGTIYSALIDDFNNDRQNEIVVGCVNNSLRLPCVFLIKANMLNGITYSTPDYYFLGKNKAQLQNCLFLPKTDYSTYKKQDINHIAPGSLVNNENEKMFYFHVLEGDIEEKAVVVYKLSYDFNKIDLFVNSNLRVRRDSLVAKGILKLPYSDTGDKAYTELLKKQILTWDGEKINPSRFDK